MSEEDNDYFDIKNYKVIASIEEKYWWFVARNQLIIWAIKKYFNKQGHFHEIGCGTGNVLNKIHINFPAAIITGSEFYSEGIKFAQKKLPHIDFYRLDATSMQLNQSYDAIGAFDVIEHIQNDELVLLNLKNALKNGGYLFLTVPQHRWLWSEVDVKARHARRYSKSELISKLKAINFSIEYTNSFVSLVLPLMWLSRFKAKNINYDHHDEFLISNSLNLLLKAVIIIEFLFIRIGIHFPIGGSLLIIAKK